jgi:hypothetical protein
MSVPSPFAFAVALLAVVSPPAWGAELVHVCTLGAGSPAPQRVPFRVEGKILLRMAGSDQTGAVIPEARYDVIADDGDTVVAATLDFPPLTALVLLSRSRGIVKVAAISNQREPPDVIATGSCEAR